MRRTRQRRTRAGLAGYAVDAGRYDELLTADGSLRSHWQPLVSRLLGNGSAATRRDVDLARRLIVENGVTYNVYADPQGRDRPWVLDPLPLLVSGSEWRQIEAGVLQRAVGVVEQGAYRTDFGAYCLTDQLLQPVASGDLDVIVEEQIEFAVGVTRTDIVQACPVEGLIALDDLELFVLELFVFGLFVF